MNFLRPASGRASARSFALWGALALAVTLLAASPSARASDHPPFPARAGLELASDAARAWSEDATLIYVENDEPLDPEANAERWGYLFYSSGLDKARVYSVRDGKIVVAEFLELKFQAPPVNAGWIDSGEALAAADRKAGLAFRRDHGGVPHTMLLMRGALQESDADATSWMVVYESPDAPSLFVLVDARDGAVRRTWRG
jgi:hypothetical protein